ncbi:hypothetical protein BH20ACT19_BH20ACT19_11970 [soil metagenome]
MKRHLGAAVIAVAVLALPASAQAAALNPSKPCYAAGDRVVLGGAGYTPNGQVGFAVDGRALSSTLTADPAGNFLLPFRAPPTTNVDSRKSTITATDVANPALTARAKLTLSRLVVRISPNSGRASRPRRIRARGFTAQGRALYMHVRRRGGRGRVRNARLGRLTRPCKTLSVKRRLFSRSTAPGRYRIIFDTARRLKTRRAQGFFFDFTVRRIRVSSSSLAAAAAGAPPLEATMTGSGKL